MSCSVSSSALAEQAVRNCSNQPTKCKRKKNHNSGVSSSKSHSTVPSSETDCRQNPGHQEERWRWLLFLPKSRIPPRSKRPPFLQEAKSHNLHLNCSGSRVKVEPRRKQQLRRVSILPAPSAILYNKNLLSQIILQMVQNSNNFTSTLVGGGHIRIQVFAPQ